MRPHENRSNLTKNGYRYYEAWDINCLIECLWYNMIPDEYVEILEVEIVPPVKRIVSQLCAHTVIRQEGKYNFSPSLLYPMVEYAREHNFKICGYAWGLLLCSVNENNVMTGYFDVWLPVENNSSGSLSSSPQNGQKFE